MARILVVDRTMSVCEALALVLELEGHTVAQATSAQAALALLPQVQPDVVLADATLRDLPFPTFCAALRRLAPAVPVVVTSLAAADAAAVDCCAPATFLAKPFAAPQLLTAVAAA
jgi:DNA-binding NtrC family response regulator